MPAKAVDIAEDVKATLVGFAWLAGYTIQRAYMPPQNLDQALNGLITIIPVANAAEMKDRTPQYQHDYVIDVAIHKALVGPQDAVKIDAMLETVDQTVQALKGLAFAGCAAVAIENDPLQDLDSIQGQVLFASLIRITCRTLR